MIVSASLFAASSASLIRDERRAIALFEHNRKRIMVNRDTNNASLSLSIHIYIYGYMHYGMHLGNYCIQRSLVHTE